MPLDERVDEEQDADRPEPHVDRLAPETVAQAAHWFDFDRFHAEVRRVARPRGVLALWTYEKFRIETPLDRLIDTFYTDVVGKYWPPERRYVEEAYRTLPFPFEEIAAPNFTFQTQWSLEQVVRYLNTWSAVQRFTRERRYDPVAELLPVLAVCWGPADLTRSVTWPIHLRVGRV
ncbi:MAG: hypothetical protein HC872_07695 [Gammaproteobacteria bacterium]|nr:hypothetical protein [Gammaproteobacteria bacterium]